MILKRPVSELRMSWREFNLWQAYLNVENPEERQDRRLASLMAHISNMAGKQMADGKTAHPDDFLGIRREQSAEDQIRIMEAIG